MFLAEWISPGAADVAGILKALLEKRVRAVLRSCEVAGSRVYLLHGQTHSLRRGVALQRGYPKRLVLLQGHRWLCLKRGHQRLLWLNPES